MILPVAFFVKHFMGGKRLNGGPVQRWGCFYGRFFVDCWGDNLILTKYLDFLVCLPHQKLDDVSKFDVQSELQLNACF